MKRFLLPRLPGIALFLALCLVVCCIPWMRHLAIVQLSGPEDWGIYPGFGDDRKVSHVYGEPARQFPNDVNMSATLAEQAGDVVGDDDDFASTSYPRKFTSGIPDDPDLAKHLAKIAAYDKLISRFPDQPWLIAARLRWTLFVQHGLPRENLKTALELAARGQWLEPRNCFFDWAMATLLYNDGRLDETIRVLHQGAGKSYYDDHFFDSLAALIATHRRLGSILTEQKLTLFANLQSMNSGVFKNAAESISQRSRAWSPERYLEVNDDLCRLAAPMKRGRNYIKTSGDGIEIQWFAWASVPGKPPVFSGGFDPFRSGLVTQYAQRFAEYALAHHRPDIAGDTHRLSADIPPFQAALVPTLLARGIFPTFPSLSALMTYWWLDTCCLLQIELLMAIAMGFSVVLIATRPPQLSRRDQAISLCCVAITMGLAGVSCLYFHLADTFFSQFNGGGPVNARQEAIATGNLAAFLLTPIIIGAVVCGGISTLRMRRDRARLNAQAEEDYDPATRDMLPRDLRPLVLAVAGACYGGVLLACIVAFAIAFVTQARSWTVLSPIVGNRPFVISDPADLFGACAVYLAIFCYFGWIVAWRWLTPKHKRPYTHYGLRWYRQTLSLSILLAAFTYIALAFASLPCRHAADRDFDQLCRDGQLATMGFPEVK